MKVFLTETIHNEGVKYLQGFAQVVQATSINEDSIIKEAQECDAILVRSAKITDNIVNNLPNLKVVGKHGIGVDNIDVDSCTKNNVAVVNAPKSNINAVAEHTVALILAACKNINLLDNSTREGKYTDRNVYPTIEIQGKTIGFIGMGNIASLVAKKLGGFEVNIIAYDPFRISMENGVLVDDINEIYKNSDIITLHIPFTKENKNLISSKQFDMMKNTAILVNAARGGIVDEDALYDALYNKKISFAAFDVFEAEPPLKTDKLFTLDNIIVSPHNAALTQQALINMATHSAQGIYECLTGKEITWLVNKEVFNS
ncbi:MAG: hydroxyacid dehydrogenase [Bacillota bacterium]|jgi:D-3-phosphoglycerate dehydrogenase|nr:hydroxyacid dehydrogenase [Bacillota bacterium]